MHLARLPTLFLGIVVLSGCTHDDPKSGPVLARATPPPDTSAGRTDSLLVDALPLAVDSVRTEPLNWLPAASRIPRWFRFSHHDYSCWEWLDLPRARALRRRLPRQQGGCWVRRHRAHADARHSRQLRGGRSRATSSSAIEMLTTFSAYAATGSSSTSARDQSAIWSSMTCKRVASSR